MANPLFEKQNPGGPQGGGIFGFIADRMYRDIPAFRDFLNTSRGKSIEQVCSERGIDPNRVKGMSNKDILDFLRSNKFM